MKKGPKVQESDMLMQIVHWAMVEDSMQIRCELDAAIDELNNGIQESDE